MVVESLLKNENHGAQPGARDKMHACHAGCFAPIAPSTHLSHLRPSAKKMKPLHYHSGEIVMPGDFVKLGADQGRIKHIGEELKLWALPNNEYQDKVMIESSAMGLVCESADCEDLVLVSRSEEKPISEKK